MTGQYYAEITVYVIENGYLVKDGSPQSMISKLWVARTKDELKDVFSKMVCEIPKPKEEPKNG